MSAQLSEMLRIFSVRTSSYFLLLLLIVCSSGCSMSWSFITDSGSDAALATVGQEENAPFLLSVNDELFDGDMLHVHARLTALSDTHTADSYLRLRGINDGEIVEEEIRSLKEIISESQGEISPGATFDTVLSIPARAVSDYQLELLWGEDDGHSPALMSALVLRNVSIKKRLLCQTAPCEIAFTLTGSLYNAGNVDISEAELGVGYVFVKSGASLDLSDVIPENEELLQIQSLKLSAGGIRPFTLKLSQTVPERSDGAFMPVVRVRSYQ